MHSILDENLTQDPFVGRVSRKYQSTAAKMLPRAFIAQVGASNWTWMLPNPWVWLYLPLPATHTL